MKSFTLNFAFFICLLLTSLAVFSSNILPLNKNDIHQWRQNNLTEGEVTWLEQHQIIRHGMVQGTTHEPFEYEDSNNKQQGLTSDYLAIIGEKLGISFESKLRQKNTKLLVSDLKSSKIDLISYLDKTSNYEHDISISKAIIKIPIVLLGRQNSAIIQNIDSINNERVVIQKNTYVDNVIKENYPNLKVSFVSSPTDGIKAINNGEADIFIHNAFSTEYYQRKLGINKLKVLAYTDYHYEIVFAVNKQLAPLIHMIEKVIADISYLEKRLIFDKWINVQVQSPINIQLIISVVTIIVVIALFIVSLVIFWNRRLTVEVNSQTKELRNLARHMDRVREEEKSKLAREIHDELGHTLTALSIGIRRLDIEKTEDERQQKQKVLSELVKEASQTSKKIMSDLRPSILEDLGLVAALEWLVNEFQHTHNITCALNAKDLPFQLKDEAAIALFRIVQESLTNIAKHANATKANINLQIKTTTLMLLIYDNGNGLSKTSRKKENSYGLIGMEERVLALGGKLKIISAVNEGVQILIKIPTHNMIKL